MAAHSTLSDLRGLGPKSQAMLARIGVHTLAQLRRVGAVTAYVRAKHDDAVSLNLLYALVSAMEGRDWRDIKRERKLELLEAVEAYPLSQRKKNPPQTLQLEDLRNIGAAMLGDFALLNIKSVKQLARCNADRLYARIQALTHTRHDPCVWDTYAAAIHQAKTGEALPWWEFTKVRKAKLLSHSLPRGGGS